MGDFSGPVFSAIGGDYCGSRVFDFDLDGFEDVLLLPKSVEGRPRLLARDLSGDGTTFYDVAGPAGVGAQGKIGGAVAGDFNGDGDIDLFLGREAPKSDPFTFSGDATKNLFQATKDGIDDASNNNYVALRLNSTTGLNNGMGIGAKVKLVVNGQTRIRLADGGSGRGGQDGPVIVFGLGSAFSVDELEVVWPNGHHQIIPGSQVLVNSLNEVDDNSTLSIVAGTILGQYEVLPVSGLADWIFTWETSVWTNPEKDRIIFDTGNMVPACSSGLVDLTPSMNGVDHSVTETASGTFLHEIVWRDRPCQAPCTILFKSKSEFGAFSAISEIKNMNVKVCGSTGGLPLK